MQEARQLLQDLRGVEDGTGAVGALAMWVRAVIKHHAMLVDTAVCRKRLAENKLRLSQVNRRVMHAELSGNANAAARSRSPPPTCHISVTCISGLSLCRPSPSLTRERQSC